MAKLYGIPDKKQVQKWVKAYQSMGNEGLMRSRKNESYSFDYKFHVVESYLSSEISYQELAMQEGLNNLSLIVKWVNDFRNIDPDALRSKKKGRKKSLKTFNKKNDTLAGSELTHSTSGS